MDNIQFSDQGSSLGDSDLPRPKASTGVRWIMKLSGGAIRDERQANYVLLGLALVFFIATIFVIKSNFSSPSASSTVQYKEDLSPAARAKLPPEVYNALPSRADN
ncbi:MAG: hypothetical protein A2675_01710 [Candidatus Yonathbacteria bacterium RIFCSPHIGHO2_01_FULL_51_10]|uniref:Uncharacterized protein n=1 Tax=Candidatus Yonathbacteria bacterium RIFCSPHIGHO2_01_FULL_51_10 TaxID=1802723 RepID=A0A1G2S6T3_9BACT|nr:MAG: hypothetical protein A2675_01710 [Candidatus Yonathbacteria bacterium RIFCSPHIGHO2_01_FULL_51_10]